MKKFMAVFSAFFLLVFGADAFGASILDITVSSEGDTYSLSFSSIEDLIDDLDTDEIMANIPAYTETSEASVTVNFRGLPAYLSFTGGSTELILSIPSAGIYEVFTGATRDDSIDLLEDWFKDGNRIEDLVKELIASTPHDPIAGNPNSLMSRMVHRSFDRAFKSAAYRESEGANANVFGIGAEFNYLDQGSLNSMFLTVPISYAIRFDNDSRHQLRFDLPLAAGEVDGAYTYSAGFGVGYTLPLTRFWAITPGVDYGVVGSVDLGSVGQILSGTLASAITLPLGPCEITMGNMGGYLTTLDASYDDYSFDPDIDNTVIRNGLMLKIRGDNTSISFFGIDTRFFGDDLYIDNYNEFGFSFGLEETVTMTNDSIRAGKSKTMNFFRSLQIGGSYLYSDDSDGFQAKLAFKF